MGPDELFETQRPRLLGLAYRMVGSRADAEDIVGEAWVRWCSSDSSALRSPQAWLTTVTTRIALDFLRSARHRREGYVGPWLAEPVVTEAGPEESAELADSLTLGFLTVLDQLDPVERAVFLMADVFAVPYDDIAATVGKSAVACRQIASRARRSLRPAPARATAAERRLVDELLVALAVGDMEGVLSRLAPEVVCLTDGGPHRRAARRPVVGPHRVARFLTTLAQRLGPAVSVTPATVNGEPGIVARQGDEVDFVAAFEVDGASVRAIHVVLNPDKLRSLGTDAHLV